MENTENEMKENEENLAEATHATDSLTEKPENEAPENGQEEDPLAKLTAELSEQKDKYIRLYSEFENFRRRTAKEKLEMIQGANEQLIQALLPVVDDFERAEKSLQETTNENLEGFTLIHNKFKKTLDQYGVKEMEIKVGANFDADFHEAITQVPAPEEKLKGKVVDVVEKGYLLKEKVIRFAKVVVGS